MGSEQFSQAVRGSSAEPVGVAQTGSLETNDYDYGAGFDYDGTAYPYTVNPAETIHELVITSADDVVAEIHTNGGDVVDLPLAGTVGTFDRWNIDQVVFRDPEGTQARLAGGWAGE
jgi:phage baseplate assembly protein gpV